MKLWCLNDSGGWGEALMNTAILRRIPSDLFDVRTFEPLAMQPGDYAFLRLAQRADRLALERTLLQPLRARGVCLIPELQTCECYEDKVKQVQRYHQWMPTTFLAFSAGEARTYLDLLPYPFLSKSRTGSASRNVRIIADRASAEQEIEQVFGDGLFAPHKLGELKQTGYLIWQELLQGNDYDYRVVITGRHLMCLKRYNRLGTIFASGSGLNEPADLSLPEVQRVMDCARAFYQRFDIKWCGTDWVNDQHGEWKLLESTLGWSQKAYEKCKYTSPFHGANVSTDYFGKDIWTVLLNEIEAGVFA